MSDIFDVDLLEAGKNPGEDLTRVKNAVTIVREAVHGGYAAKARLEEAFTTSDFPSLFNRAVNIQVASTFKETPAEWIGVADKLTTPDLRETELVDMSGLDDYEDVAEGEEFKGKALRSTGVKYRTRKTGLTVGFTYEDFLNGDFEKLLNIGPRLSQAARRTEDKKVFGALFNADASGLNTDFFTGNAAPTKLPLTAENLETAISALGLREDFNGNLIDTSRLVLVVHPAMRIAAERLVNAPEWEVTSGNRKTREANPFRGMITVVAPRAVARLNKAATAATTWVLLPAPGSSTPALAHVGLAGHENPDLRYKADQGAAIGGGSLGPNDGSFQDDTTWFRGRHFTNGAVLLPTSVYASTGA